MQTREALIVLGIVVIAVLVWDGWRRMRVKRHATPARRPLWQRLQQAVQRGLGSIRSCLRRLMAAAQTRALQRSKPPLDPTWVPDEVHNAEDNTAVTESPQHSPLPDAQAPPPMPRDLSEVRVRPMTDAEREQRDRLLSFDHYVPLLLNKVGEDRITRANRSAALKANTRARAEEGSGASVQQEIQWVWPQESPKPVQASIDTSPKPLKADQMPPQAEQSNLPADNDNNPEQDDVLLNSYSTVQPIEPKATPVLLPTPEQDPQQVIVIHVAAQPNQGFSGGPLLQILLACGLRFGAMDIFHRHSDDGCLQFSMANSVNPGQFDLEHMGSLHTPGVSFFMQLPNQADAPEAFDYMYETANCVARHLQGQLLDEQRQPLTVNGLDHYRQRIAQAVDAQAVAEP